MYIYKRHVFVYQNWDNSINPAVNQCNKAAAVTSLSCLICFEEEEKSGELIITLDNSHYLFKQSEKLCQQGHKNGIKLMITITKGVFMTYTTIHFYIMAFR